MNEYESNLTSRVIWRSLCSWGCWMEWSLCICLWRRCRGDCHWLWQGSPSLPKDVWKQRLNWLYRIPEHFNSRICLLIAEFKRENFQNVCRGMIRRRYRHSCWRQCSEESIHHKVWIMQNRKLWNPKTLWRRGRWSRCKSCLRSVE